MNPLVAAESGSPPGTARSAPIGVGDQAPDFTLLDRDGRPRSLSEERSRQDAVVLIFYRGHW
jgi:peroxiredoxin